MTEIGQLWIKLTVQGCAIHDGIGIGNGEESVTMGAVIYMVFTVLKSLLSQHVYVPVDTDVRSSSSSKNCIKYSTYEAVLTATDSNFGHGTPNLYAPSTFRFIP